MKKFMIIAIVLILLLAFFLIRINNNSKPLNIINLINGKTYKAKVGDKIEGILIKEIEENKVVVEYLGEIMKCDYNKEYQFWPDSQGGKIMWEAPFATLIFEKQK